MKLVPKVLAVACFMIILGSSLMSFKTANLPEEDDIESYEIVYEVSCSQCNVVFRNQNDEPEKVYRVTDEWKHGFEGTKGQFVYVSATYEDGKETKVVIKRGGQAKVSSSSQDADKTARVGLIL